ncbi:terpene synthase family protein [Streptomyces sp. PTM05]|uniref:Terpene synthase family protein n=1 Tax=Streptantibioticus parmotrematis TaxID=2873249 RepID=A0ABS7QUV8_9ACTN|nr:terpene synthase family protein [Streptantibioticus parmotrematis]MBY8886991.1 terpene synthase family protein [Streptantibioticus parmotrematis]
MLSFSVPVGTIPHDRNPCAAVAHKSTRGWANRYRLIGDDRRQRAFDQLNYAELLSYACTTATASRLGLFAQWFTYYFLLDDQQDLAVLNGRHEEFVALQSKLRIALHSRGAVSPSRDEGLVAAVADLCRRTAPLVSDGWWYRYVTHAEQTFAAQRQESDYRLTGVMPTPWAFKKVRREAGAAEMVFDIIEACEESEIPESIRSSAACRRYADDLNDFTTWSNDVLGVQHDAANTDPNNYVLVREHADGLEREAAIAAVISDIVWLAEQMPLRRAEVKAVASMHCSGPELEGIERVLDAWRAFALNVPLHYLRADSRLAQMDGAAPGRPAGFISDLLGVGRPC